ncbi:hypothetical protein ALON55S_02775 [Alishewanella longhuensis]
MLQQALNTLACPVNVSGIQVQLSASIGVSFYPQLQDSTRATLAPS